jgi:NTP pyrophosphatase (non-canonical NTP hydrolase)
LVQRPIQRATGYSGRKPSDLFRPSERPFDESKAIRVIEVGEPLLADDVGLRELQKECWQTAENHGFHDVGRSFGDVIALIVSEAAEAFEAYREGHALDEVWYEKNSTKICGVGSELADILIRTLDAAEDAGIDLMTVTAEKMAYNKTRPFLHGKTL